MQWFNKSFDQLTVTELYQILRLRQDVFVVEQDCAYPDIDGKDSYPGASHFFAQTDAQIVAYMRLLPPGCSHPDMSSLGRVVTHTSVRGTGLGHQLLTKGIELLEQLWPNHVCHISAQAHLQKYYAAHGFVVVTAEYLEDDIPHVGMERNHKIID